MQKVFFHTETLVYDRSRNKYIKQAYQIAVSMNNTYNSPASVELL
jgi:hypothetical protein